MLLRRISMLAVVALIALTALPASAQTGSGQQGPIAPGSALPGVFERASAALDAGDVDQAALDFSLFLLLNPTYSQGFFGRGLARIGQENYAAAVDDLTRAVTFAPADSDAYAASLYGLRAQVHQQLGDDDAALADFSSAVDLNPSGDNYANRAFALAAAGDNESALEDLDRAIALLPDQAILPLARASVNGALGNTVEQASDFLRYLQLIQTGLTPLGPLEDRTPRFVTMEQGAIFTFTIEGTKGQRLSVRAEARPGDAVDPLIVVLDPEGNPLAANDDSGDSFDSTIDRVALPEDGRYTIILSHALGGSEGQVAIAALLEDPA